MLRGNIYIYIYIYIRGHVGDKSEIFGAHASIPVCVPPHPEDGRIRRGGNVPRRMSSAYASIPTVTHHQSFPLIL
jgi:hypothetical protein